MQGKQSRVREDAMLHTRLKRDEAAFFLGKLEATATPHFRTLSDLQAPPEVVYYLSAFIGAARSVPWVMRAEMHAVAGWENWFRRKMARAPKDLLSTTNTARISAVKKGALVPVATLELIGEGEAQKLRGRALGNVRAHGIRFTAQELEGDGSPGAVVSRGWLRAWHWEVDEINGDLLTTCRRYQRWLDRLVRQCEERFGRQSGTAEDPA